MFNVNTDRLYYYSGSADKPVGAGANEYVQDRAVYAELSRIPHWRRVLSNFHECNIQYRGRWYKTVEHAYQAQKLSLVDDSVAFTLSLDSGHERSYGDGAVARRCRKLAVLNSEQVRYWQENKDSIMTEIMWYRFWNDAHGRTVLLLTGEAELWHGAPRIPAVRQYTLETVRYNLRLYDMH